MATILKYLHVANSFHIKLVSLGQGIKISLKKTCHLFLMPHYQTCCWCWQTISHLVQWFYVGPGKNIIASAQ